MKIRAGLSIVVMAAWPLAAGAAPARIGVAAAVSGEVRVKPPEAAAVKPLASGEPVHLGEKVSTGAGGRLQILLLDETTFTVGSNSAVTLDEFVYDPATNIGKVSADVAQGAFRFVTGKLAKKTPTNMKIKTPCGTIGIRGTSLAGQVDESGGMVAVGSGKASVENAGVTVEVAAGFGTMLTEGSPPSEPFRVSAEMLSAISASGGGKGSGGAGRGAAAAAAKGGGGGSSAGGDASGIANSIASIVGQDAERQSNLASLVPDGITQFSDILSIPSGTAQFTGSGVFIVSSQGGLPCAVGSDPGCTGTFNVSLTIDYGARTFTNSDTIVSGYINDASGSVLPYTNANSGDIQWYHGTADFNGTYSFTLNNANNRVADNITASIAYDDNFPSCNTNCGSGGPTTIVRQ